MISLYIGITQGVEGLADGGNLPGEIEELMSQNILYIISVASILICGIVFYFWYRHETRGRQKVELKSVFNKRNIILFLIIGIGCQLFFSGVMNLIQPIFPEQFKSYGETMESILGSDLLLVLLYTIIIAPISEELIFRGVILHRTRKVLPFLGANLLQALFFGVYHRNIIQGIYATIMGFLLGLIYQKYNTIYSTILLHMIINASVFVVILFPITTISYVVMVVLGVVGTTVSFVLLKLGHRESSMKEL
jgi:membrane protease YdiL (CAAX protease family)